MYNSEKKRRKKQQKPDSKKQFPATFCFPPAASYLSMDKRFE